MPVSLAPDANAAVQAELRLVPVQACVLCTYEHGGDLMLVILFQGAFRTCIVYAKLEHYLTHPAWQGDSSQ